MSFPNASFASKVNLASAIEGRCFLSQRFLAPSAAKLLSALLVAVRDSVEVNDSMPFLAVGDRD